MSLCVYLCLFGMSYFHMKQIGGDCWIKALRTGFASLIPQRTSPPTLEAHATINPSVFPKEAKTMFSDVFCKGQGNKEIIFKKYDSYCTNRTGPTTTLSGKSTKCYCTIRTARIVTVRFALVRFALIYFVFIRTRKYDSYTVFNSH